MFVFPFLIAVSMNQALDLSGVIEKPCRRLSDVMRHPFSRLEDAKATDVSFLCREREYFPIDFSADWESERSMMSRQIGFSGSMSLN